MTPSRKDLTYQLEITFDFKDSVFTIDVSSERRVIEVLSNYPATDLGKKIFLLNVRSGNHNTAEARLWRRKMVSTRISYPAKSRRIGCLCIRMEWLNYVNKLVILHLGSNF